MSTAVEDNPMREDVRGRDGGIVSVLQHCYFTEENKGSCCTFHESVTNYKMGVTGQGVWHPVVGSIPSSPNLTSEYAGLHTRLLYRLPGSAKQ